MAEQSPERKLASRRTFLKVGGLTALAGILAACGETDIPPSPVGGVLPGDGITPGTNTKAPTGGSTTAPGSPAAGTTPNSAATATPATATGDPRVVAEAFLTAWQEKRYSDMYQMLNSASKQSVSEDKFVSRYSGVADEATIVSLTALLGNSAGQPSDGQPFVRTFPFNVQYKTARVGDFTLQNRIAIWPDGGRWAVDWKPTLIFPQLTGTNLVRMQGDIPLRGDIMDRYNKPLAKRDTAYSIFVVKGKIADENAVLDILSQTLQVDRAKLKPLWEKAQPDWRVDVGKVPATTPQEVLDKLIAVKGIGYDDTVSRSYPNSNVASNVVGYINRVNADDLKTLAAQGYTENDVIGRTGVEAGSEKQLAGVRGGNLTIVTQSGEKVADIASKPGAPSANVHLALDLGIQGMCEGVLGKTIGSIVVLDPNNGDVLALATYPTFNPNEFIGGINSAVYNTLINDPHRPLFNRPLNGTYPTGSTFKIISAAAALEKAGIKPDTYFQCAGRWTGLGDKYPKDCWLKTGHGRVNLVSAITQSCDIYFYEVGKKLDSIDPTLLPNMTRAFGLGAGTGISGIYDEAGIVPDPAWKQKAIGQGWVSGDAVNLAIGQGYLLASPLQLALAYAGLATGNVPQPRLATAYDANSISTPVEPKSKNPVPVSPANLALVRQGLFNASNSGSGTSTAVFAGAKVKVSGKTGTAESGKEQPHSWYAAYAPSDNPRYVIVAMAENGGEGSAVAAPMVRKVVDQLSFT